MKIYLIGIGMGEIGTLTNDAMKIISKSKYIIGAARMVEAYKKYADIFGYTLVDDEHIFTSYKTEEICDYIEKSSAECDGEIISVLFSGSCDFYSGATRLHNELISKGYSAELVPGISSISYLSSKAGISWEDAIIKSVHGRRCNLVGYIVKNHKVFSLLSCNADLMNICDKLKYYKIANITLYVGYNLSLADEKIISCKAEDFKVPEGYEDCNLISVFFINNTPDSATYYSIPDDEFIRGAVPMTKQEIRAVSIGKLRLNSDSVLYDVGAGSGSVSIEAALLSPDIQVFAFEKNDKACELIEKNKQKFKTDNVVVIEGNAPESFADLKTEGHCLRRKDRPQDRGTLPTHAFIGGSSGNMKAIIDELICLNEDIRIVINVISLESIAQVMDIIKDNSQWDADITSVQSSRSKNVGEYHLMTGMNPVYIITLCKKEN